MLARFRVLLPFVFTIPFDSKFVPISFTYKEYRGTLYPPAQANIDSSAADVTSLIPFADAGANLDAALIATPTQSIKVNERETIQANLLQIDLVANREFDRDRDRKRAKEQTDPPVEVFFEIANYFVKKFRSIGNFVNAQPLTPDAVAVWRIEYLTDEGLQLERDEKFSRSVHATKIRWQQNVLTPDLWNKVTDDFLTFKSYVWDSLLVDARAQNDDVNAAIVLANAALEAAVDFALETLAGLSKIPKESFDWLANKRDFTKQPSAKEKFDQMLFLFAGRSLKTENPKLWKAFLDLRDARNSMVHQGAAVLKKGKEEVEVDAQTAMKMVTDAAAIIVWLEKLLPEECHRQKFRGEYKLQLTTPARGSDDDGKEVYIVGFKSSQPFNFSFSNKNDK